MGTRKGRSNLEKYLLNTRDPFLIRISRLGGGRGRIRIVDVIADGGSEEKGIYCRNFRKFFRGTAALFPGTKKRRLHAAGGTSWSRYLSGWLPEGIYRKQILVSSLESNVGKTWRTRCETPLLCFFPIPSFARRKPSRTRPFRIYDRRFVVFLSSFLPFVSLFGRNRA